MKRSEMIKLIEENFGGEIRENAENILGLLEEAGMQPPSIDSDNPKWRDYYEDAEERYEVWGWEKE